MATAAPPIDLRSREGSTQLARQWRTLTRTATLVAVLTSPGTFLVLDRGFGWDWRWAAFVTFLLAVSFRGLIDVLMRRFVPWPSLFGTDEAHLREEDVLARRRAWFWRAWVRRTIYVLALVTIIFLAT